MMCYTQCLRAIHQTQLNPTISYLHTPGERRYSLSLDVSEVFKPLLVDRVIFKVLNKREIQERIEEVLDLVGMSNKGYKLPNELSGGEQQHIVIARAVLNSPAIILADEPTGNLDVETGKSIVELLHNICESGSSVVMTTHNLQLLKEYPGSVYRCSEHRITDVTDEYMPRQRTIEIDLNIDN